MTMFSSFTAGFIKVNRSIKYILLIYAVNLGIGLAFSLAVASLLEESLGTNLTSMKTTDVFDALRHSRDSGDVHELVDTLDPELSQVGTVLRGLDSFMAGDLLSGVPVVLVSGLLYLLVWLFFSGGLIAFYINGPEGSFFRNSTRYYPAFLLIALIGLFLYYLVFSFSSGWLNSWVLAQTRNEQNENIHLAYLFLRHGITWLLVFLVNMIMDYSKVCVVISQNRNFLLSALKGLLAAVRMIFSHLVKTFGLYLMLGLTWIVIAAVYWIMIPSAETTSMATVLLTLFTGQLFVMTRIWLRCFFYSSQSVMGQSLFTLREENEPEM